jgi:hypothetical protein
VVLLLGGWAWGQQLTVKNYLVTKIHKKPRTWTDSLDNRPKQRKMDMIIGTWNVRSMYRAGSLRIVAEEVLKYKLDLVGVQEVRWDESGTEPAGQYTFFYGKGNQIVTSALFPFLVFPCARTTLLPSPFPFIRLGVRRCTAWRILEVFLLLTRSEPVVPWEASQWRFSKVFSARL